MGLPLSSHTLQKKLYIKNFFASCFLYLCKNIKVMYEQIKSRMRELEIIAATGGVTPEIEKEYKDLWLQIKVLNRRAYYNADND